MSIKSLWTRLEEQLTSVFASYRYRLADLPVEVKADRTLLTEADVAVQRLIIAAIRDLEPEAVIIAEEDERSGTRSEVVGSGGRVWVVDPIDGTAEFVRGDRVEFCSVVCLLEDWQPSAAFVLAPELGVGRTPLVASSDATTKTLWLNGRSVDPAEASMPGWISATRSNGDPPRSFDSIATQNGFKLKTQTTSQTLDMLRAVIDLSAVTDPALPSFEAFWRRQQKVWDGVAGLALGSAAGRSSCDEHGDPLLLGPAFLSAQTPTFASTVMGRTDTVDWLVEVAQS